MTTPPGPGTPPPGGPPPIGGAPLDPAPPRQGMSGTAKVLIGCGIAMIVVLVLIVAVIGGGAWFLDRQLGDADAGLGRQLEVTRVLNELEEEVDFTPPANGVISEVRAQRFFAVTDESWTTARAFAEDVNERSRRVEDERRATFGDAVSALRGMGRARISLAEALQKHAMPPSEYVWTGLALLRAHERSGQTPEESGVPAANLELARRHSDRLEEISRGDEEGRITRGAMFGLAHTFILSEDSGRRFAGWDSLQTSAP